MKRIALIILLVVAVLFPAFRAHAASPAISSDISSRDEVHQYSVLVKENGSANAFLQVNNIGLEGKGGEYRLNLPAGSTGEVKAWYVDNGVFQKCIQPFVGQDAPAMEGGMYSPDRCFEAVRAWVPIETIVQEGDAVMVTIPKTQGFVSLGITWKMTDVTDRHWWGRKATITTPVVDRFVSYTNVAVDFPDGVYVRDKAVGPVPWGDMVTGVSMSQPGMGMDEKMAFVPEMFDRIGGETSVFKGTSNLQPGESYTFTLLTATSRWKLFVPEIATMLGVSVILVLVLSLLLRLLIGRKPFAWYLSVVALLILLAGLVLWLFRMYTALFPRPDYPVMYEKMQNFGADVMMPERLDEPENLEGAPAPSDTKF